MIPVIFRMWNERPSSCIAFLPSLKPEHPWNIVSYESSCGIADASPLCFSEYTRPAGRGERRETERELKSLRGELEILTHLPRKARPCAA